jgi:hypothetical protein
VRYQHALKTIQVERAHSRRKQFTLCMFMYFAYLYICIGAQYYIHGVAKTVYVDGGHTSSHTLNIRPKSRRYRKSQTFARVCRVLPRAHTCEKIHRRRRECMWAACSRAGEYNNTMHAFVERAHVIYINMQTNALVRRQVLPAAKRRQKSRSEGCNQDHCFPRICN